MEYVWAVLVGFSCAASLAACLWLLMNVGSRTGGSLLPVQLVNLALADALYDIGLVWDTCVELAGRRRNATVICCVYIVSLLMQVHIALGFLALFWRLPRVMRVLQRTPYLTWLVSLLVGAFLSGFVYREIHCFASWTEGVTGCVVSVIYVMVWLRSWCYPLREEVRAYRMVWLFPLTFVITYGRGSTFAFVTNAWNILGFLFLHSTAF